MTIGHWLDRINLLIDMVRDVDLGGAVTLSAAGFQVACGPTKSARRPAALQDLNVGG